MGRVLPSLAQFGPPVAWMAVIAAFSGRLLGAEQTESYVYTFLARLLPWASPHTLRGLHTILRKMGHLIEYGILAALWLRAFAPGRSMGRAAGWAVGLSALYAVVDEARQSLAPNRSPAALDVVIDTVGAVLAVACLQAPGPLAVATLRLVRWATVGLTVGSLASAVVDWSLGLGAGDLALAALGLALAAWALGRMAHAWRKTP